MKRNCFQIGISLIVVVCALTVAGSSQTHSAGRSAINASRVPSVVNYSGVLADLSGKPLTNIAGVTFALYKEAQGGAPLWIETQSVHLDKTGHYSVMLGSTTGSGLPADMFVSGEARWLGVQVQGQPEQARVLLVAVPYALKAGDAETVGGLPASAFVLAAPSGGSNASAATSATESPTALPPATITGSGTAGYIPDFTGAAAIGNSAIFQTGTSPTAKVGINTITPSATLDVRGTGTVRGTLTLPATGTANAGAGKASYPINFAASSFNSTSSSAVLQNFRVQAEPVGNNTAGASASLNLLFGSGSTLPSETGLSISRTGVVTFAPGQLFPGTGTVTSVGSGLGLVGGPITGSGTLSINTSQIPQLHAANTFTHTLTVNGGDLAASGNVTAGADMTAVGTVAGSAAYFNGSNPDFTLKVYNMNPSGAGATESISSAFYNTYIQGGYEGLVADGQDFPIVANTSVGPEAIYASNTSTTSGATGILGIQYGTSGVLYGVTGYLADNLNGAGVFGIASTSGESNTGANWFNPGAGVWGDGGLANYGVLGTTDSLTAGFFENAGSSFYTVYAYASDPNGYPLGAYNSSGEGCSIDSLGNLNCTGSKNAVVPIDNGQKKVALSAIESPQNWFEDFGSERLSHGVATVTLEPAFAQTVNTGAEYHVFLTPKGECEGLYVTNEGPRGFQVRELHGGTSNVAFDYRIVALRKNFENIRMADHTHDLGPVKMVPREKPVKFDPSRMTPPSRVASRPVTTRAKTTK